VRVEIRAVVRTAGYSRIIRDGVTERRTLPFERGSVEHADLVRPLVEPSTSGARELGRLYWEELERATGGLVRARVDDAGVRLVLGRRLTLLRFGAPELEVEGHDVGCRYSILGGALVSRPGGSLAITQRGEPSARLEVAVEGYRPALAGRGARLHRGLFYRALQAPLHRSVSRRFLERAERRAR
jgi:hypothetical protein